MTGKSSSAKESVPSVLILLGRTPEGMGSFLTRAAGRTVPFDVDYPRLKAQPDVQPATGARASIARRVAALKRAFGI